jgi:hypothetical protein
MYSPDLPARAAPEKLSWPSRIEGKDGVVDRGEAHHVLPAVDGEDDRT